MKIIKDQLNTHSPKAVFPLEKGVGSAQTETTRRSDHIICIVSDSILGRNRCWDVLYRFSDPNSATSKRGPAFFTECEAKSDLGEFCTTPSREKTQRLAWPKKKRELYAQLIGLDPTLIVISSLGMF